MDQLENLSKNELIKMVQTLNEKMSKLQEDYKKVVNLRLYNLERSTNLNAQYLRRDTIELSGIPESVSQDQLEDEVIDIFKEVKITVNRQPLKKMDIQAVHRIGKKGRVIMKVVNRKFAQEALSNGKRLKDYRRYGEDSRIYINESFIPEFGYLNYIIRKALKEKKIYRYKVRNGVNFVQVLHDDEYIEIAHQNDLENIGIVIPEKVAE